jgi:methionine synthase I (cobalamin-dependent)
VTTQDSYINFVYRIPGVKQERLLYDKPVIAFMHDVYQSADDIIATDKFNGTPLALQAANMGYDVWFLNSRGNQYSTHRTLNKVNDEAKFYNYTWQ